MMSFLDNHRNTMRTALLIGNSDGIGLATTRRLLSAGWETIGISRSMSPITDASYQHHVCDVTDPKYPEQIAGIARDQAPNLCIYFAGIGEFLDPLKMTSVARVFEVNLMGMVRTVAAIVPPMIQRGGDGHFIGVSSLGDELVSPQAPSYYASKAGFSNYLGGLRLALKPKGVDVTNIRFGFVDTKMAKGEFRPFMMSVERAADHVEYCIRKRPAVCSAPRIVIPFLKVFKLVMRLRGF